MTFCPSCTGRMPEKRARGLYVPCASYANALKKFQHCSGSNKSAMVARTRPMDLAVDYPWGG